MDIRIARTDRAIEQAFMELREKNPLEKIKIKDLCAMACINKSTFYAHYEDIYALANALENKLIESILASVPRTNDSVALHQAETLTRELFHAFMQNQRAVNILFSGSRQGIFANSIEKACRAASTPLPTTAAGWTRASWWSCWEPSPRRRRASSFKKKKWLRQMPEPFFTMRSYLE